VALSKVQALRHQAYYPDSATFDARIDSYWSKSAALEPWCMVLTATAGDASEVMKVITANDCPFGIRGGGHSVFPLSSSVEDGITIDFGIV
jgi:FAD/FMN-containing dehydrogenase